jgi:hypothetical protein
MPTDVGRREMMVGMMEEAPDPRVRPSVALAFGTAGVDARGALPSAVRESATAAPRGCARWNGSLLPWRAARHNDTPCTPGDRRYEPDRNHSRGMAKPWDCPPIPFLLACSEKLFGLELMLQTIRDLSIILMATGTVLVSIGILVLIWQIWKLVDVARDKFDTITSQATDILGKAQDTAQAAAESAKTAAGTTEFVADKAARPVIEALSVFAGAAKFAEAVVKGRNGRARAEHDE